MIGRMTAKRSITCSREGLRINKLIAKERLSNNIFVEMKYYSAIKKNEIMSFAGKWVELEIMLSKISQTEKDKYYMFSLICRI
jgi:hypothetical protein